MTGRFEEVPGHPIVGNFLDMLADPAGMLLSDATERGDFLSYRFGPWEWLLINDPEAVRYVLVQNHANYVKSRNYVALKLVIGQGLVTSEGALWKRQRKLAQPVFTPKRLLSFLPPMGRCTSDLLEDWERHPSGREVDVHEEMMRLTFRIVGLTLTGQDLAADAKEFGTAVGELLEFANRYTENVLRPPIWLPLPSHLRFRSQLQILDSVVQRLIRERRANPSENDLLGMLLRATDQDGGMSDQQLRDEMLTMILAGHETTAVALSWTWYLLSRHPLIARRLADEVDEVLGDRVPTAADLDALEYTERVLKESMRLFPPVWAVERDALSDDVICGRPIRKGVTVGVAAWTLHRHRRYWDNPEGFDPDRWLPERSQGRPRYVYLPFGAGPRVCIGSTFAMMEAKLILAMIVRRYRLELAPGHPVEMDPGITLRPKHGIRVRVVRRDPPASTTRMARSA
ncbi:MAG: cytochrome P450 [Myxococcota bacterium]